MAGDVAYPTVDLLLDIHEQIVEEDEATEAGIRSADAIESALQYVSEGFYGEVPSSLHEKAVHLRRLLVADYPFVDGNKRTALRTVVVFYMMNGTHSSMVTKSVRCSTASRRTKRRSTWRPWSSTSGRVLGVTEKRT